MLTAIADTAASVTTHDTPMVIVLAVCAVCNLVFVISQAFIIPFVRGMKTDMKELATMIQEQKITLVSMEATKRETLDSYERLEARVQEIDRRDHAFRDKMNDLVIHLAATGIYKPISVRTKDQEGRT